MKCLFVTPMLTLEKIMQLKATYLKMFELSLNQMEVIMSR